MPDIRTIHIAPKVGSFPTDRVFYCDPEGTIVNGRIGFYLASGVTTSAVTGIRTGLDVNITSVQAKSGAVISFEVSKLGLNYKDGDVVMIAQAGSGLNATFKVNTSSTLNQGDVFTVDNGPLDANGIPVRQEAYSQGFNFANQNGNPQIGRDTVNTQSFAVDLLRMDVTRGCSYYKLYVDVSTNFGCVFDDTTLTDIFIKFR